MPAYAQVSSSPPKSEEARDEADSETVQADDRSDGDGQLVTVTGSRIKRPNFDSLEPTLTLDADDLLNRGFTSLGYALDEIPQIVIFQPSGPQASDFGTGPVFINLYGLGPGRTLTLVNGRRYVSSNPPSTAGPGSTISQGNVVDISGINPVLVERIDAVAVGGAPAYGSDAIAGAVNVILKTRYQGLRLSATTGITEEGDNLKYSFSGAFGTDFAQGRGNITASVMYDKEEGFLMMDRERGRIQYQLLPNPPSSYVAFAGPAGRTCFNDGRVNTSIGCNETGTDGIPANIYFGDIRFWAVTAGGTVALGTGDSITPNGPAAAPAYRFNENGNLVTYDRGNRINGAQASGGEGFKPGTEQQLYSDVRRITANLFANYDLTDSVRLFAEGTYYNLYTKELSDVPYYNSSSIASGASGPLTFRFDNPFLTDQARATLLSLGVSSTGTFRLNRALVEFARNVPENRTNLYRVVAGVEGDFQLGGRDFNYEVSLNYGRTNGVYETDDLNQQNFVNAVTVTRNAQGQIVCDANPLTQAAPNSPTTIYKPVADPLCVPLNLFGEGKPSQAAIDYVTTRVRVEGMLEQRIFNANVGGSLFDIWGGPVAFNIGYEHREERGSFSPDDFLREGRGRRAPVAAVAGKYNVDEVFGELLVPVVSPLNDVPFIHKLELVGRGRYVDNTVNGGFFAWTLGGNFAPIKDVEFRGNFTRSFRAPALAELYQPRTVTTVQAPNLCQSGTIDAGVVPKIRRRNCDAFLAKYPLGAQQPTGPVWAFTGGNPTLENETADAYTFGVKLKPRFLPKFSATVDYINYHIKGPIAPYAAGQIGEACFDAEDFNLSDPANGNKYCSLLKRDANGIIINDASNPGITTGFTNGLQMRAKVIQAQANYIQPLHGLGLPMDLALNWTATKELYRTLQIFPGPLVRQEGASPFSPTWQVNLGTALQTKQGGISFNALYINGTSTIPLGQTAEQTEYRTWPAEWTFHAGAFVTIEKGSRFTVTVSNITNQIGVFPTWRVLRGRQFTASLTKDF